MDQVNTLRRAGLFDAKVPRYTSYPPANRFVPGIGARLQPEWLGQVDPTRPVSVYAHIPFCRRLCWFCACRTQGTQTLKPVAAYLDSLLTEIDTVTLQSLPKDIQMSRLHLGGGTPTLLDGGLMTRLLDRVHARFSEAADFEFSVEIDPTEAAPEVLDVLAARNMTRASIGVQDFDPKVQKAIGREQGFDLTAEVVSYLRKGRVRSLNVDFLYGLPFQTAQSLLQTLDRVVSLRPDRIALYGYAHVPHVSKRQVMIRDADLPDAEQRFVLSELARERLMSLGYVPLGIDHFALPHDTLTVAAQTGRMGRNFQGYTDDPCDTLIGFGASAISKFPQGFLQNAPATSAYVQRIQSGGLAAHKGYPLTPEDIFVAALIDGVMCQGRIAFDALLRRFPDRLDALVATVDSLQQSYPDLLVRDAEALSLKPGLAAAARLIAARLDQALSEDHIHSMAV